MSQEHMTVKEIKAFRRLQKKMQKPAETPLTEADLEAILARAGDIMAVSALQDLNEFWTRWCDRFRVLADDNSRLVAEVRRLNEDRAQGERTHD